jgi:hypothetical protein
MALSGYHRANSILAVTKYILHHYASRKFVISGLRRTLADGPMSIPEVRIPPFGSWDISLRAEWRKECHPAIQPARASMQGACREEAATKGSCTLCRCQGALDTPTSRWPTSLPTVPEGVLARSDMLDLRNWGQCMACRDLF